MSQAPEFIETLVTSTRIRLARHLAAYPFPDKLNQPLAEEILYLVGQNLNQLDDFKKYDIRA